MAPTKVLVVYGTRPEAIKMAPVVSALRSYPDQLTVRTCTTAQHRQMLDQVHEIFGLIPDIDLDLMEPDQSLNRLAGRALQGLDGVLAAEAPDWLLVQGDTTTAMAAALGAFHRGIRVGHVEAGLRTGDLARPFPEEANRRIVDLLAAALFVPTTRSRDALLAEGVPASRVHLTGNTVIDALQTVAAGLPAVETTPDGRREVLVTVHRRESFGDPLRGIFAALAELATRFPDHHFVYPVHPNPNVRRPADEMLGGLANFELRAPLDYRELVAALRRAHLVLTDSGGIQEEAPAFGIPALVLRDTTERPEGCAAGVAALVGTETATIVAAASRLLSDPDAHAAMANAVNPYGDGLAATRIAAFLAGEPWQPFDSGLAS